jgi:hypothetical protein
MFQELTRALASPPHTAAEAVEQVQAYLLGTKGDETAVRQLKSEWYYLRTAIEAVYFAKPATVALPYRVLAEYCQRSSTRTRFDQVMEKEEQL